MDHSTPYTDLGLVNTREMFKKAMAGGYAVPAYNFNNMEQLQAIVVGCVESNSPVMLQVSGSARKYANPVLLPHMVKGAVAMAREMGSSIPIALHLDHGVQQLQRDQLQRADFSGLEPHRGCHAVLVGLQPDRIMVLDRKLI